MRWHLLTTDFPPQDGGLATWSAATAAALHAAGEEVVVHARARSGATPGDWPFEVRTVPGRSWAGWGHLWMAASARPRLGAADRVLAATWPLARWMPGGRLAIAYHGSDLTRTPPPAHRGDAVHLAVSDYLGRRLGVPYTRLPAPVDPVAPVPRGEALLVVARLVPSKGVDRVLRLGARLGRRVVVVGDGPERATLEATAAMLGVEATFTGRLAREAIPWAGTWAACLLSRAEPDGSGAEGLGLALLEAAARGIPSIGSAVGGIPEVADVVLADPERDPVPPLPDSATVQARLARRDGTARLVETLRGAWGP